MELTDSSLDDDARTDFEIEMPDAELFDHLGLDDSDRRMSKEGKIRALGEDPFEWTDEQKENSRQLDDDYPTETPPAPDEYDKCDLCGATDSWFTGQSVEPRPTSVLTAPAEDEYLCPECYGQVAAQYIGLNPYPAVVAVLLSDGYAVWRIAEHHDRDWEEIEDVVIGLLAEWQTAYDADEHLREDEREYLTDREKRFLELFPRLGINREGIEIDSTHSVEVAFTGYGTHTAF